MKDIWHMVVGDMPASYQWAGAVLGFVLASLLLVAGQFGSGPQRPIKQGFTDTAHIVRGSAVLLWLDRVLGIAMNVVFWLVAGTLGGYLAAMVIYLTWPWCVLVVTVVASVSWLARRWWRRREGLE